MSQQQELLEQAGAESSAEHSEHSLSTEGKQKSAAIDQTLPEAALSDKPQKQYVAIARIQGKLVGKDNELFVVTDGDNTRFAVSGIRPGKLPVRLIATPEKKRRGVISFWPRSDGSVVVASLIDSEEYTKFCHSPQPDEMLLSGTVKSCHTDKFTVQIKKNKTSGRSSKKFKGTVVTVSSAPPNSIQCGQWADLKLQRDRNRWLLSEESATEE